jgi:hypothetical protein
MEAQSCGTMILAVRTGHGVYLAADSRMSNPVSENAQKIFMCRASAFIAISGTLILRGFFDRENGRTRTSLNLMKVLTDVSSGYAESDAMSLPEYIAERVHGAISMFCQKCDKRSLEFPEVHTAKAIT